MENSAFYNDYIFFLQLGKNLPTYYYQFASHFSKWDITVVPIKIEELLDVKKGHRIPHIVVVVPDLETAAMYVRLQERIINFSLKTKRFYLHDVNSFGRISIFKNIARLNVYQYFELPVNISDIAGNIAEFYYSTDKDNQKWPGGRRAKLPATRV
ncbi:MAG: hypothetical protein KAQ98_11795 [Bacteriovoracaceae bacterium]|nr:hypothetical protein [Bacteriovoracaceae bacterium]